MLKEDEVLVKMVALNGAWALDKAKVEVSVAV